MNRRIVSAVVLLALALPAIFAVLFMPTEILLMQVELDWRRHRDPVEFLSRWPESPYQEMAAVEFDRARRADGFVSRLLAPSARRPDYVVETETTAAAWSADGAQLLTGSATQARRWDAATGRLLDAYGWAKRRDADDTQKWGYGFAEVAWTGSGGVVAMTHSAPHSLWHFAPATPGPMLLEGQGLEQLTAHGRRVAYLRATERAEVLDVAAGRTTVLDHPDVTAIAFAPDGAVLTASRKSVVRWDGGTRAAEVAIDAAYNPLAFSLDGQNLLVVGGTDVEVWRVATGEKRTLPHEQEAGAACATADTIATATDDGHVQLWAAEDGAPMRRFRASVSRIALLVCSPARLLTVSSDRAEARVWDLAGRPQSGLVRDAPAPRLSWITTLGADLALPERAPWLVSLAADAWDSPAKLVAIGALTVVSLAAAWLLSTGRREAR